MQVFRNEHFRGGPGRRTFSDGKARLHRPLPLHYLKRPRHQPHDGTHAVCAAVSSRRPLRRLLQLVCEEYVYHPNSYHEANPVYRQIGRAEGAARSDISSAAKAAGASTAAGGASGGSARLDDAMRIGYLGDERELAKRCAVGTAAPRTPAPDASARCRHQRPYQGQTTAS